MMGMFKSILRFPRSAFPFEITWDFLEKAPSRKLQKTGLKSRPNVLPNNGGFDVVSHILSLWEDECFTLGVQHYSTQPHRL